MKAPPSNPSQTAADILAGLERDIGRCMHGDRRALRRGLSEARRRLERGQPVDRALARLQQRARASTGLRDRRAGLVPGVRFPDQLPVSAHVEEITTALERHQVLVLCGETGSGKTTQLPKLCLRAGRGVAGTIGHTQPRRLAARSVAVRIAEELGGDLGQVVGYKVRFSDQAPADCLVKLMTDGILLAEIQRDPLLEQYDTLIIDEAHERSLNIDFLLGYLRRLLPKRPDLKVIITSATIDPQRFSRHFFDAPVINVSGRTWPVEVRYRPLTCEDEEARERDQTRAIVEAVDEVAAMGPGDVLVFLSGEREIRDTAEALRKHHPPATEILPLYARLSFADQNRVFRSHPGRRIVLATNVAETSLTVPGIRYVVDPGRARISRYSPRSKVQRLPVEAVSRASARQRAGRCGRVSAGVCIRLYSEEDYAARSEFTDPEIRRTNLASVVLQMAHLSLGTVEAFPFLDPPEPKQISDAYALLQMLGAVDADRALTTLGRRLAQLPMDPRLARLVLAGEEHGALQETLIIAAVLSVQDPRERPLDEAQAADRNHVRFADPKSDFVAQLKLWRYFEEQSRQLSGARFRKLCKSEYLSWLRLREWRDVHRQVREQVVAMGMKPGGEPASYEQLHKALLTAFLDQIGLRDPREGYLGARGRRFFLFPGSGLSTRKVRWLVCAELVETTRLFARISASVDPAWIERVAPHLLKRSYSHPRWEKRIGRVTADESVTLFGLVLAAGRRIDYARVDAVEARAIFLRDALIGGHYSGSPAFLSHNRALLEEVVLLETKSRRPDILVDTDQLFEFYDHRVPADVVDARTLERWLEADLRREPRRLFLTREQLMTRDANDISEARFPDTLRVGRVNLPLHYHFDPASPEDGVTATLPAALLDAVPETVFEWLVPGLLPEKITALIRGLPKSLRRNFVPAPEYARVCLESTTVGEGSLTRAISAVLQKVTGLAVPEDAWQPQQLPGHLRMRFRLVDEAGEEIACGRDLQKLRAGVGDEHRTGSHAPEGAGEQPSISRDWDFGVLPPSQEVQRAGIVVTVYPAIAVLEDGVTERLFNTPEDAEAAMGGGLERLIRLRSAAVVRRLERDLPGIDRMCLQYRPLGSCKTLRYQLTAAILRQAFVDGVSAPRDRAAFEALLVRGQPLVEETSASLCRLLAEILDHYHELNRTIKARVSPQLIPAYSDLRAQLDHLVHTGFLEVTSVQRLRSYPRYLRGMRVRLQKLALNPGRDRERTLRVAPFWKLYLDKASREGVPEDQGRALRRFRWLIEEFRISVYAQELGTGEPVSEKRLSEQRQKLR